MTEQSCCAVRGILIILVASCHSDWLHCTKLWSVSSELKVPLVSVIEESDELKQSRCVNIKVFPVVSVPSEEQVRTCSV